AMVLGAAFQSGRLPFSLDDLEVAFRSSMKSSELAHNLEAFRLGRLCYEHGSAALLSQNVGHGITASEQDVFKQSLKESFPFWVSSKKVILSYEENLEKLIKRLPEIKVAYLAQYLHDIYLFDRTKSVSDFFAKIEIILE